MRPILLLASCIAIGGCVAATPPPPQDPDSCGASQLQHLLGGTVPQPFPAQGPVRIYRTGDAVTMDFSADRINVEVSPQSGMITSIHCG